MTVRITIEKLRKNDIIVPNEWISELAEVMEEDIHSNAWVAICKVISVWKDWMLDPSPEEKGKIAGKALKSFSKIKCSSFNIISNSRSNIKHLVSMSKNTPDIVTIINDNATAIFINEFGRKEIL